MVQQFDLDIKVAVMGCVVNGPGEAKEADLGIAGGKGVGLLIKKGEIVRKVPEAELLDTLREELEHWAKLSVPIYNKQMMRTCIGWNRRKEAYQWKKIS